MSVERLILKLERLVQTSPALANVPIAIVDGRPVTPIEALRRIRQGDYRLATELIRKGYDPDPNEVKELAKEFFKQVALAKPGLMMFFLEGFPSGVTLAQALEEIEKGTEIGKALVEMYERLLKHVRGRMLV